MHKAAFLDRDGVINIDHGYTHRIEDFQFVPGTLQACRELAQRGWRLVVVTNQSGIGRGFYTVEQFRTLTDWMTQRFAEQGAPLAGVYFCPHRPDEACACRKPMPGMLVEAAHELSLDLAGSILFGDKCEDMQAAQAAGIGHRVLLGKNGQHAPDAQCPGELAQARFACLADAVRSADLAPVLGDTVHV